MNGGIFKKNFPVVSGKMEIGDAVTVEFYGEAYTMVKSGAGDYDFVALNKKSEIAILAQ